MQSAVLRGADHALIGAVASVGEGAAAIALSRGGAPKRYAYTDPNEDCAAFAEGPGGLLLAVADGHSGAAGSARALEHLWSRHAGEWTAAAAGAWLEGWEDAAVDALFDAGLAVAEEGGPRTTLSLALLRPSEKRLAWASVGDSHAFWVEDADATDLAVSPHPRVAFLGRPSETRMSLAGKCVIGTRPLAGARAVALVTDGLSERGIGVAAPSAAVAGAARTAFQGTRDAPDRAALETALGIVERTLEAQRRQKAGDNIAVAVGWVE